MPEVKPTRREQLGGTTELSPDEIKLLKSYEEAWPKRLHAGFQRGNPFFAWLMIAKRPHEQCPTWCTEYFTELAIRLLQTLSAGDDYHATKPRFDFDDFRKAFVLLGIDQAARKWGQAHAFWAELEMMETEPDWMAEAWDAGTQFSQRQLVAHDEYVEDIHRFISQNKKPDESKLDYGSVVAKEGVEFDWTRGVKDYESYASMLRAMRNRRKLLEKEMIENGARPGAPGRPSRSSKR